MVIKNYLKLQILIIGILFLNKNSYCQYYDIGQDPASIKWKQIKTEHFNIIFPSNFQNEAERLANLMDNVYYIDSKTLKAQPKKTPIIIHNRTVVANAFSIWTPRRMEFFTCTPQNTYSQDWLEQLALHEYRHIVQMSKLNNGLTKFFTYLTGEQATAAVLGLYVPTWFMEGDAVCMETVLSKSGRGRDPSFDMDVKANTIENKIYSFDKATMGSYRDYVPDQYNFGYNFVSYVRSKYGFSVWENAMKYAGERSFMITPFNYGMKEITGLSKSKLYFQTFLQYILG